MEKLEKILNYNFKNKEILRKALTHKSFNEGKKRGTLDNEKLEFLGDSVINLIVTTYLFKRFKKLDEGELSKLKAHLVSSGFLFEAAKSINLGDYILLGKGEEKHKGRNNKKIIASLFEAVVGALYIDSNFKVVSNIVLPFFRIFFEELSEKSIKINDYKSELQELIQKHKNSLPEYKTLDEIGKPPDVVFNVVVLFENKEIGRGTGRNKRQAEQDAAYNALKKVNDFINYKKLSEVFFLKSN